MSIIIIAFPSCPKVDPEAVKQEAEVNSLLEKKVNYPRMVTTHGSMQRCFNPVMIRIHQSCREERFHPLVFAVTGSNIHLET